MSEQIEEWMSLYKNSPSIVLFEDMSNINTDEEERELLDMIPSAEALNPMDVVLESLINIISEKISSETTTQTKEKVLLNPAIRQRAVEAILSFIKKDYKKIRALHKSWLSELSDFLRHLYQERGRIQTDEVLFQVSKRFRISGVSAIKAVSTIVISE